MSAPFDMPNKTSGRVILHALVTAKPGEGDKVQALLAEVRKRAESSGEKDTHTYRTCRGIDGNEDKFLVFEEYSLPNGIKDHVAAEPFQVLGGAGVIADLKVDYFTEFLADNTVVA